MSEKKKKAMKTSRTRIALDPQATAGYGNTPAPGETQL